MNNKLGIFSFFSGAGFLDLGFELSKKFDILFANEFHQAFADAYVHSRKELGMDLPKLGVAVDSITDYLSGEKLKFLRDQTKSAKRDYPLVGYIGGPPCPDFSVGGKNAGHTGENGRLSSSYIDLICETKPDFFLFENVKGLYRTTKHRLFFEQLKQQLRDSGYVLTEKLINALEYGAPQHRERIILVGVQSSQVNSSDALDKKAKSLIGFDWSKNIKYKTSETEALPWPTVDPYEEEGSRSMPNNIPIELTVEHWFKQNNVAAHPNTEHYFKPRAGLAKFMSVDEGDDLKKSYKRLHRWRYSPTAAYGNNEVHLHPYKSRRITVAEALAVQSLPQNFSLPDTMSLTDMFKTIGNGVPFEAALGLAKTLYQNLVSLT